MRNNECTEGPAVSDERDQDSNSSEQKMRRALEARRGSPFTDEEWDEAKRNLVGMFLMMGLEDTSEPEN
jgi:hypothetical protein